MSEQAPTDYTSLDFLSSLRNAPKKKRLLCQLSLNTDLQQINQVLKSPTGAIQPKIVLPTTLDIERTKIFVMSLLQRYESEEQSQKKWEGFLKSVDSPQQFQKYVHSLKEITVSQKIVEPKANPQVSKEGQKESIQEERKRKVLDRVYSSQKLNAKVIKPKEGNRLIPQNLRKKIKNEIEQIKDLLTAGQNFILSNERME